MSVNTSDLKSFHYLENGEVTFSVFDTVKTIPKLEVGTYKVSWITSQQGGKLEIKVETGSEDVELFEHDHKEKLDNVFNGFFDKNVRKKIKNLGFYHKLGIILYGKQGTGKSTIIKNYCAEAIKKNNAIVMYINFTNGTTAQWDFVRKVRAIQDNPIIIVIEEIDEPLKNGGVEGCFKRYFDGNESIDDCIILASTNYINDIPKALKDRPSRFKYCLEVKGISDEKIIYDILNSMIGDTHASTDIIEYARKLVDSTLDEIKQFGLDKIMDISTYSTKNTTNIGFVTNKTEKNLVE
jgi:SpoVK/Ycf46/Vps4 family AAA+-type ATPase